MKTSNVVKLGGAMVVISLLAFSSDAYIAFDTGTGTPGNQSSGAGFNLGQAFTVGSQDLTVGYLGAFDAGQNGWGSATITVAIYNSVGNVVGSAATFNSTTPGSFTVPGETTLGGYRFLDVTDFTLTAGSTYRIVASGLGTATNPDFNAGFNGGVTTIVNNTGGSLLTFGGNYWSSFTGTPAYPTTVDGGPIGRYGAGTFDFTPVPEAETFGAAAVGLLGLVYVVRHVRIRRKLQSA